MKFPGIIDLGLELADMFFKKPTVTPTETDQSTLYIEWQTKRLYIHSGVECSHNKTIAINDMVWRNTPLLVLLL